jgi:chorismate synthase
MRLPLSAERPEVLLGCVDAETEVRMKEVVDEAYRTGDTVGGVFEVVAHGVPVRAGIARHLGFAPGWPPGAGHRLHSGGEGSRNRLARRKARPASARRCRTPSTTIARRDASCAAPIAPGGLEGGITNGQDVVVRGLLKPISTLRRPLESVDLPPANPRWRPTSAPTCAWFPPPASSGEAMVAMVLAQAFLEKFGGDSLGETRRNFEGYLQQVRSF